MRSRQGIAAARVFGGLTTAQHPAGARVRDFMDRIRDMVVGKRVPEHPMVAVNARYAKSDHAVAPGDEVAIIPPVAGG